MLEVTSAQQRRLRANEAVEAGGERAQSTKKAYLVLDEKLDTLDGSGGGLRDGGRDTTHCR